jgi:hypothetical protein
MSSIYHRKSGSGRQGREFLLRAFQRKAREESWGAYAKRSQSSSSFWISAPRKKSG